MIEKLRKSFLRSRRILYRVRFKGFEAGGYQRGQIDSEKFRGNEEEIALYVKKNQRFDDWKKNLRIYKTLQVLIMIAV